MAPKTSIVWKHFLCNERGEGLGKCARCRHCNVTIKYSGNTTNLMNHLKRKHDTKISSSETKTSLFDTVILKKADTETLPSTRTSSSNKSQITKTFFPEGTGGLSIRDRTAAPQEGQDSIELMEAAQGSLSSIDLEIGLPKKKLKLLPINEAFKKVRSFEQGGQKYSDITEGLLYMIAKDALPFSTVEKEGFKYFLKTVQPLYKLPSRHTVTRLMDTKYKDLSNITKNMFKEVSNFVLTTDIWTETQTTISYLGLTAHFIKMVEPEYELKSVAIGVFQLFESHTAAYIQQNILKICDEWNIEINKVIVMVTDNGSNIVKAATDIFGKDGHLPCFAHTLNLVPGKAIDLSDDTIKTVIKKIKDIVTFTKQSVSASDELRRIQLAEGKLANSTLKLIQEIATRWNSTFHMLERFVLLSGTISTMLLKFPKSPPMLSAFELEIAKQMTKLLKPLETVTVELSGSTYVTCSNIIPLINCTKKTLNHFNPTIEPVIHLKSNILKQIEKRFQHIELVKVCAISTILDPRYKKIHFNNLLEFSSNLNSISAAIKALVATNTQQNTENDKIELESSGESECEHPKNNNDDIWSYHDLLVTSHASKSSTADKNELHVELKHYLQQPPIKRTEDPLKFWKNVQCIYPNLSKLAFKYLTIVATSVPSERLFSSAGHYLTQYRNRLSPARLSSLLFLGSLSLDEWMGLANC